MLFSGKAGVVQRVLPHYRAPFFNTLSRSCTDGLGVFAGDPKPDENIQPVEKLEHARLTMGRNLHIFNGQLYLCIQIGLLNWLAEWDPDALIVEANPRYLRTSAAVRWMHRKGRPVIGWGLGAPPLTGLSAPLRRLRRRQFISQFDALITYSQTGAAEYAALRFPQERIFTAVNAVTPPPAHPLPQRPDADHQTKARILFVGRLQARKNIDNLIRACSRLPQEIQPELIIVGDGPERQPLADLAAQVYPKTTFTGACYGNDLVEQFISADLFVLPGTGGLAIQEAMSYGLPVIAAEADGTQADLVRPENGWQVPPDDIPALQSALAEALADLPTLRKMGAESYRIVAEEINLDQMVAVFIEALNRSTQ